MYTHTAQSYLPVAVYEIAEVLTKNRSMTRGNRKVTLHDSTIFFIFCSIDDVKTVKIR